MRVNLTQTKAWQSLPQRGLLTSGWRQMAIGGGESERQAMSRTEAKAVGRMSVRDGSNALPTQSAPIIFKNPLLNTAWV